MDTFQTLLAKKLVTALTAAGFENVGDLTPATDPRFGDYQTNAALILAQQRGENPRALAQKIIAHLDVAEWCESPTIAGAGFINFALKPPAVAAQAVRLLQDERLGVPLADRPRRIVRRPACDFRQPLP